MRAIIDAVKVLFFNILLRILLVIPKIGSAGVGQPLFLGPSASINFLSLSASAPAPPDSKPGRLLGISRFLNHSRYIQRDILPDLVAMGKN
jgi:hypothetical protein